MFIHKMKTLIKNESREDWIVQESQQQSVMMIEEQQECFSFVLTTEWPHSKSVNLCLVIYDSNSNLLIQILWKVNILYLTKYGLQDSRYTCN